tara:strand:+ start:222 stop:431 length:210 start_codon:yes stop_codon:yes gene_type:complete
MQPAQAYMVPRSTVVIICWVQSQAANQPVVRQQHMPQKVNFQAQVKSQSLCLKHTIYTTHCSLLQGQMV